MNKFVKEELKKCKVAQIPFYDDDTTHLVVPKSSVSDVSQLTVDDCILIEFENYILNPPNGFTLHDNWNNGVKPTYKLAKACVSQLMGKMIKLTCIGVNEETNEDINELWEGWVPLSSIKIIKNLG